MLDADATVEGYLPPLTADVYRVAVHMPNFQFSKKLLIRSALPWRYEGVLHEYPVCEQASLAVALDTLLIRDYADGGRRPPGYQPRWELDIDLLEKALARDPSNTRKCVLSGTYLR